MKIAIIGRGEALYQVALLLGKKGYLIKLIITAKESPEYTKRSDDYKNLAQKLNSQYIYSANINSEKVVEKIRNNTCDIAISINYVNIISSKVINLFKYGILNVHGGDLPKYKGNACQAWAIINGEKEIALSIHKMEGGILDTGDIISKSYLKININTKVGEIYDWIESISPRLLYKAIRALEKNALYCIEKANYNPSEGLRCYPRIPSDAKINWQNDNISILRLINASGRPFEGAFCNFEREKLYIIDAELDKIDEPYLAIPGQIAQINTIQGYILVITGNGIIKINLVKYLDQECMPTKIIKSTRKRLT